MSKGSGAVCCYVLFTYLCLYAGISNKPQLAHDMEDAACQSVCELIVGLVD